MSKYRNTNGCSVAGNGCDDTGNRATVSRRKCDNCLDLAIIEGNYNVTAKHVPGNDVDRTIGVEVRVHSNSASKALSNPVWKGTETGIVVQEEVVSSREMWERTP